MKKALIVYNSKTGITKKFGQEIDNFCIQNGLKTEIVSIDEFKKEALDGIDYLFLGCWTSGLMILLQHPEQSWVKFADSLPQLKGMKIVLFTTYKLATGSMFKKMMAHIKCDPTNIVLELKSRNGKLLDANAVLLKGVL
ncbi:MAG TPA: flavodoxin family protein [Prolixibacteraceae bacterium]|nr:flavodoxin family protein [Prolixibacteraceae bacterium]HPS12486.1 flavodoxin family protein [Prolixibacteraceae bacterium]